MNTLVLGQKTADLRREWTAPRPDCCADRTAGGTTLRGQRQVDQTQFAIVFAALGVKHDVADFFRDSFSSAGALARVAMFLNLADDPAIERVVTPKVALTLAEFLAFEKGMHVLVVLTDMTNTVRPCARVSSARVIPGPRVIRDLYSELASMYSARDDSRARWLISNCRS